MQCPYCGHLEHKVLDSRVARANSAIRRRRECLQCERRFSTYEEVEIARVFVVKKDGSREEFSGDKLVKSMSIACRKRDVSLDLLKTVASKIERQLQQDFDGEVSSLVIGDRVLEELFLLDSVAYVRFASVYKAFETVSDFDSILTGVRNAPQFVPPAIP